VDPKAAQALDEIAAGLGAMERGVRRLAAVLRSDVERAAVSSPHSSELTLDEQEVVGLWDRLGEDNRAFLVSLAREFPPPATFNVTAASERLGIAAGTYRARLMNIGRSLKSLGNDFTVLWDSDWDHWEMKYRWRSSANAMILELAK
jgi:hypothetical protein